MANPATGPIQFKIASEPWEFDQIHRLNYRTFVEEIPQHPANGERMRIDPFHEQNTYVIAVRDRQVVGMVAVRGERPFSLDGKLPDLDGYLPSNRRLCEVRLLAIPRPHRNGFVFRGLLDRLIEQILSQGYELAVISGTLRQAKLYAHLGFVPFGPQVGSGQALYQPMYLTLETLQHSRTAPAVFRAPWSVKGM